VFFSAPKQLFVAHVFLFELPLNIACNELFYLVTVTWWLPGGFL